MSLSIDEKSKSDSSAAADRGRDVCILGIDHGETRIGLAIQPAGQTVILPLGIVAAQHEPTAIERIRSVIAEREVQVVVVGLPVHANPEQARKVKRFTRKLRLEVRGVRWRFVDEAQTSAEAAEGARAVGPGKRGVSLDDRAAALIVHRYLQSER